MAIFIRIHEYFWTDSQVVLGFIKSNAGRFKIFLTKKESVGWFSSYNDKSLINKSQKRIQKPNIIGVHAVILSKLGKTMGMIIACCHYKSVQSAMTISLDEIK